MTPEHRAALAELSIELRNNEHPTFDLRSNNHCIGYLLGRRIDPDRRMAGSYPVEQLAESREEMHQVLILFYLSHHPAHNEQPPGWFTDQVAAADRIDRFLATGRVWP